MLKIFPNPFREQFIVQYTGTSRKQIIVKLFDAAGRIFLATAPSTQTINDSIVLNNLNKLSAGVYYAIVEDETGVIIARTKLLKE